MIAKAQVERVTALELRRATREDRRDLVAMYLSFEPKGAAMGLPPHKEPQQWLDRLAAHPNFIVRIDGRLVGHAVLCVRGYTGEIALFIHQDYRGRGLAKKVLRETIEEARRLGLRRVWAVAEFDNFPMFRLALSLGFVPGKNPHEFYLDLRTPAPAEHELVSAN